MPFLDHALRTARARSVARLPARPRIIQLIGTLGPGGAERQLCNFVIAARRLGHDVRVILMWEPVGQAGHYYHLLENEGVDVRVAGATFDPSFPAKLERIVGRPDRLLQLPNECRATVVDVLGELLTNPADVLHAWLDGSNLVAGIAGILAQVPRVVLSTRNVNPTHFPFLHQPYYHCAYKTFLENPSVRLINNSNPGADDYADWLSIPRESVAVVLNGLDTVGLRPPSDEEIATFRQQAMIPAGARPIAGVFRMSEEKQPLVFLEVLRGVVQDCPDAFAVIAGVGPLESQMRDYVAAHHLERHVSFVGRLSNVTPLYGVAQLTLLCSRDEGTPNVLLESQWLGCPVVATKAGGSVDAVRHGVTGYLCDVGDSAGLRHAVVRLLRDEDTRERMAAAGPSFISSRFSVDRMVAETLGLYGMIHEDQSIS